MIGRKCLEMFLFSKVSSPLLPVISSELLRTMQDLRRDMLEMLRRQGQCVNGIQVNLLTHYVCIDSYLCLSTAHFKYKFIVAVHVQSVYAWTNMRINHKEFWYTKKLYAINFLSTFFRNYRTCIIGKIQIKDNLEILNQLNYILRWRD